MSKPIVPEVSLIFDDSRKCVFGKEIQPKSYKEWKQQQTITKLAPNQQTPTSDRKKIVTFDLPIDTQPDKRTPTIPVESTPIAVCQQLELSICEPRKNENVGRPAFSISHMSAPQYKQQDYQHFVQHQNDKRLMIPTQQIFEDMYNRAPLQQTTNQMINTNQLSNNNSQPSSVSKEITLNEIYKMLQSMQSINQPPNTTNNNQNDLNRLNAHGVFMENHQKIDHLSLVPSNFQASSNTLAPNNDEPTMRDMLHVIMRQQEQLMNIQSQVQTLLMRPTTAIDQFLGDANANVNQIDAHTKQVGVMTSLEINVKNYKPSVKTTDDNISTPIARNKIANNQNIKSCGCMCNCNIQKLQQQSSDSGSNDDNFDNSPRQNESQKGWTFYGNILNQVNDVLQNTSPVSNTRLNDENQSPQLTPNTDNYPAGSKEIPNRRFSNGLPNIRTTKIKQVGFQIDDVNISAMTKRLVPNENLLM